MKLVAILLASVLALPAAARADEHAGPSPAQRAKNKQLKRALMDQFDANGDGKLGPQERARAVRVLARIQAKLAGKQQGRPKMRKFIQRFDTNRDGTVDQSEMPPGAARRMRRMDRDRDGWVEPNEVR